MLGHWGGRWTGSLTTLGPSTPTGRGVGGMWGHWGLAGDVGCQGSNGGLQDSQLQTLEHELRSTLPKLVPFLATRLFYWGVHLNSDQLCIH